MKEVHIDLEDYNDEVEKIKGFQNIYYHIIFDVKMGNNFRYKSHLLAGGHTTEAPLSMKYSSVVSCDSIRIALEIVALNGLKVL